MRYLTHETCTVEKAHYAVLFPLIHGWEEGFWREDDPAHRLVSTDARLDFSLQLFRSLSFIAEGTLRELHRQELAAVNPMLGWNPALAPADVSRRAEQSLLDRLTGDPELLYRDRPLLREDLRQAVARHARVLDGMLHRLLRDSAAISEAFFDGRPLGQLLGASSDHADAHQDGQHACILRHEAGSFVYKPHSLAADQVLHRMAASLFADVMVIPPALDMGDYGWVRFVRSAPVTDNAAAARFFRCMGGVAAVVQAFGSTDLHMENVLCVDGLPTLVDVETFLSARPDDVFGQRRTLMETPDTDGFRADFVHSVFCSGLLPRLAGENELSPLLYRGRDSMLPVVDGVRTDVLQYQTDFLRGFREIYDRCMAHREQLLDWLSQLARCRFRVLLRDTNDYARLLQTMYAPRHLSSPEAREQLFDRLRHVSAQLPRETEPEAARVVARVMEADIAAYRRGDVPFYQLVGNDPGLYAGPDRVAERFVTQTAADAARIRIRRLSSADRDFEAALLREALRCAHVRTAAPAEAPTASPITADTLRDAADSLLRELAARRFTGPSGAYGWMDHTSEGDSFGPMELASGMGYTGLGTFATEHFAVTGDPEARSIADQVMEKLERKLSALEETAGLLCSPGLLGMTNGGGILRFSLLYAQHIDSIRGMSAAARLVRMLSAMDLSPVTETDFYGGMAGMLYILSTEPALYALPGCPSLIHRLGDRLLSLRTLHSKQGILTWDTLGKGRPISGLGHGIAGVGLALAAAWKATGEPAMREAAVDAFTMEHLLYEPRLGTWPDFRESPVAAGYVHGICSGAPGMALALLKLRGLGIPDFDEDLRRALDFTLNTPPLERDHYCCGNSGVIECLLEAGQVLQAPRFTQAARERTELLLQGIRTRGQPRFMAAGFRNYSPLGQLNGLSGAGHVLLRQLSPGLRGLYV